MHVFRPLYSCASFFVPRKSDSYQSASPCHVIPITEQGDKDMNIDYELRLNDGNGVSADGKKYILHKLNPNRGLPNEPEYIHEEIPIENGEGWAAVYKDAQSSWATAEERYHDEQVNVNGVPVEDGENPMEVMLSLVEDNKLNPENVLKLCEQQTSEQRKKIVALLEQFKGQLNEEWQELLFQIYYLDKRFSDLSREHEEKTGKKKTNQAFSKQHKKAIDSLKDKYEAAGYEVDRTPKRKKKNQ